MDVKQLRQFAEQDLDASKAIVKKAQDKLASLTKALEKEGTLPNSSCKSRALGQFTKNTFDCSLG